MVGPEFRVPGSVVRITLQDFMTYRHETIWPGPAFNVTVGPNGSGKSSIVTALAICLGGDLQVSIRFWNRFCDACSPHRA